MTASKSFALRGIWILTALFAGLTLSSCGDFMDVQTRGIKKSKNGQTQRQGLPPGLGGRSTADEFQSGVAPSAIGELTMEDQGGVKIGGYELPSDENIVWSDERNPEANIEFEKPFLKPSKNKGTWQTSYTEARRESLRSGKPVVVWFTDNGRQPSPICKILSRELFSLPDFNKWAENNIVRLRLDLSGGGETGMISDDDDLLIRKREYLERLKKQYSVLGLPTVIVLSPDGSVIDRYRGYQSGESEFYWGRIRSAVAAVERQRADWQAKMEKKGYRKWGGKNGVSLMAKLVRYHEGNLYLVEPDGNRIETTENNLAVEDRRWIEAQKAKRR